MSRPEASLPSSSTTPGDVRETSSFQGRYSLTFRCVEIAGFVLFLVLMFWLALVVVPDVPARWPAFGAGMLLGVLVMDLLSGLLHWGGDTWGSVHWPVIGPSVLRTFREHHVDPEAITRHDVIEVNATSCIIAIPTLLWGLFWTETFFWQSYALSIGLSAVATNQIHLWAHRKHNPWWIRHLQRLGLILTPEGHALHHQRPYTDHYCITTGWLNRPLAYIKFFRGLEWIVSKVTGAKPRAEDEHAELAVIEAHRMAREKLGTVEHESA